MVKVVTSFLVVISIFASSFSFARSIADYARDVEIGTGVVLTFVVLPGIAVSVGGAEAALTCGQTVFKLNREELNQFLDVMKFDAEQAAQSYRVTCAVNHKNERVFVSAMAGQSISKKMLYTRLNRSEKCLQAQRDAQNHFEVSDLVVAEEAKESRGSQDFFTERVFKGQKTECNSMTAALAQFSIQQMLRTRQIEVASLFPLFFRNNLATDPRAFIPNGDPLLKPISVEEFLAIEKRQYEAWDQYYLQYPNAKRSR